VIAAQADPSSLNWPLILLLMILAAKREDA